MRQSTVAGWSVALRPVQSPQRSLLHLMRGSFMEPLIVRYEHVYRMDLQHNAGSSKGPPHDPTPAEVLEGSLGLPAGSLPRCRDSAARVTRQPPSQQTLCCRKC